MVVTTNQNFHLYVAKSVKEKILDSTSVQGDVYVGKNKEGKKYIQVKGEDTVLRSALIDPKCLISADVTKKEDMRRPFKKVTLALSENAVDEDGNPIVGQDYVVHITVRQFNTISDEYSLIKTAGVHVTKGLTKAKFMQKLAVSLWLNFSRELSKLVSFELGGKTVAGVKNDNGVQVPVDSSNTVIAGADSIVIKELPQEWKLGTMQQVPVFFEVRPTTIYADGDEVIWGTVTDNTPVKDSTGAWSETLDDTNSVGNGKTIADMEYFALGERGDQYRLISWPNYIDTKYSVDPSKEYNALNIHFAWVGPNEMIQKSEQDIMIVAEDKTVLDSILTKIKE